MEFFSYTKYPHLTEIFDQDYCNDGSHVKDEVSVCHFSAKGVLVEETSSRAAVVHDNGDSQFRHSYRLRKWNERACKAITKAKKEREKVSYMYDLSIERQERHRLAYPNVSDIDGYIEDSTDRTLSKTLLRDAVVSWRRRSWRWISRFPRRRSKLPP